MKLTTDGDKASCGLSATAELLVSLALLIPIKISPKIMHVLSSDLTMIIIKFVCRQCVIVLQSAVVFCL